MVSSVTTLKWTERGGMNVNNLFPSPVGLMGQAMVTCLTREVDGFVRLDKRHWFVGLKHDFSWFHWVKLVSADSDSEGVDLVFLHLWSLWHEDAKVELTITTRERINDLNVDESLGGPERVHTGGILCPRIFQRWLFVCCWRRGWRSWPTSRWAAGDWRTAGSPFRPRCWQEWPPWTVCSHRNTHGGYLTNRAPSLIDVRSLEQKNSRSGRRAIREDPVQAKKQHQAESTTPR